MAVLIGMAVAMFAVLFSASVARADTLEECQQKLLDGTLDLEGYLACLNPTSVTTSSPNTTSSTGNNTTGRTVTPVSSTTTSGSLPTTGSNSGRFVGVGAALIVLGGAALYGATRNRRETTPAETSAEE